MERQDLQKAEELLTEQIKERIPGDAIQRVAVLQYGDDPEVEPGELLVRIYIAAAGEGRERARAIEQFVHGNEETFNDLREQLPRKLPGVQRVEVRTGDDDGARFRFGMLVGTAAAPGSRPLVGGELTPVMARLGAPDLETLDTLITAGIASNRAEAVRWAIGRIRERPAYERLRERAREIEELKAQF